MGLLLADDDHMLARINEVGLYPRLVQTSLLEGRVGIEEGRFEQTLDEFRWGEW